MIDMIENKFNFLETQLKTFSKKIEQKPNIFEIIKVSDKELVHSNMIAWLFSTRIKNILV